jgi:TonB family protein
MLISAIVILAHALTFVALERVNIVKDVITFGYQGPPRLEPDISIIDSRGPERRVTSRERRVMIVQDVFIEGEDKPNRTKSEEPQRKIAEEKLEQQISLETPGDYQFRSYPAHAAVPYREDYVILKMVQPLYPLDAITNMEEGYVLVEAYIGFDGTVNEVYVRNAYGPRSFETASLDAVKQFLFKPVRLGDKPISFWVSFLVRFQLRR